MHLAYASIYFEKKDFAKAFGEINKVNLKFFVFKYDVRVLTLKIYYEKNSIEPAFSLIDTFIHLLSNNSSTSETNNEAFNNFLKFIRQLFKQKSGDVKTDPISL